MKVKDQQDFRSHDAKLWCFKKKEKGQSLSKYDCLFSLPLHVPWKEEPSFRKPRVGLKGRRLPGGNVTVLLFSEFSPRQGYKIQMVKIRAWTYEKKAKNQTIDKTWTFTCVL